MLVGIAFTAFSGSVMCRHHEFRERELLIKDKLLVDRELSASDQISP